MNGIEFPSKAEAAEYVNLKWREHAGDIFDLKCQPQFDLVVNDMLVGRYTADFSYRETNRSELLVVVEVKGRVMRDFPLRRNLFKALYPGVEYLVIRNGKTKVISVRQYSKVKNKNMMEEK